RLQLLDYFQRLIFPSRNCIEMSHICGHSFVIFEESFRLSQCIFSLGVFSLLFVRPPEIPVGDSEVWIHLECLVELLDSQTVLMCMDVVPAKVGVYDDAQRIKFQGALALRQRVLGPTHCHQTMRVPMVSVTEVRIQLDRAPELCFRTGPVPVEI